MHSCIRSSNYLRDTRERSEIAFADSRLPVLELATYGTSYATFNLPLFATDADALSR